MKVIIWGYPLYSHTHSYIHYGWVKAFKSLNYETYWFHDNDYAKDFDYENCLFISEGYADKNIPIVKSSTYFIHVCVDVEKYKNVRLIDLRYFVDSIYDVNYDYKLNKEECEKIGYSFYEKLEDNSGITKYKKSPIKFNYEALYICWATDLLPEEFDFNIKITNNNVINYIGSNIMELEILRNVCFRKGIQFNYSNPWSNHKTFDDCRKLIVESVIAPDIRSAGDFKRDSEGRVFTGTNHLLNGYIPCRVFKNISYGKLGITNSKAVYDLFRNDGVEIIYNQDIENLITDGLKRKDDIDLIRKQMEYVQKNHTYINRVNDILKVYNKQ